MASYGRFGRLKGVLGQWSDVVPGAMETSFPRSRKSVKRRGLFGCLGWRCDDVAMTLYGNRTSPTRVRTRTLENVHQDMFSLRSRSRWRFFRDLFERARFSRGFRPLRSHRILDRRWRPVRGRIGRHPFCGEAQDSPVRDRMRPFFLNGLGEQEAMMIPASAKNRGVTKQ